MEPLQQCRIKYELEWVFEIQSPENIDDLIYSAPNDDVVIPVVSKHKNRYIVKEPSIDQIEGREYEKENHRAKESPQTTQPKQQWESCAHWH